MTFPIIDDIFGPLYGKPCWNTKYGYGIFMILEFGGPYIEVRGSQPPVEGLPENFNKRYVKRRIDVQGAWRLWIYCCEWRVFTNGRLVGDSDLQGSTKNRIKMGAYEFVGQKLLSLAVDPSHGTSVFEFDLGSRLETRPYDKSDQWRFYEPSGDVFTYGFDGRYKHQPGDTLPENDIWQTFE